MINLIKTRVWPISLKTTGLEWSVWWLESWNDQFINIRVWMISLMTAVLEWTVLWQQCWNDQFDDSSVGMINLMTTVLKWPQSLYFPGQPRLKSVLGPVGTVEDLPLPNWHLEDPQLEEDVGSWRPILKVCRVSRGIKWVWRQLCSRLKVTGVVSDSRT